MDFSLPNPAEIAALDNLMNSAEEVLRLPPEAASERLKTIQNSLSDYSFL
jgi:hypothetical protein